MARSIRGDNFLMVLGMCTPSPLVEGYRYLFVWDQACNVFLVNSSHHGTTAQVTLALG